MQFVDEQDGRPLEVRCQGLQERSVDQELVREDVGLKAFSIRHARGFGDADLDHLASVVPLVDCGRHVQALITLEADQAPP